MKSKHKDIGTAVKKTQKLIWPQTKTNESSNQKTAVLLMQLEDRVVFNVAPISAPIAKLAQLLNTKTAFSANV